MTKITPYGDDAVLINFDGPVDAQLTHHIHAAMTALQALNMFTEIVPGYDSLLIQFNPLKTSVLVIRNQVEAMLKTLPDISKTLPRPINIPICYEGGHALDLDAACTALNLSRDEIITLHSAPIYTVCMLGFIPGFTFLSAAHKRLHMPRHKHPRAHVPPGSVGIANWQTGIYALGSPGGWQILGRTPWRLFDPKSNAPFRFKAGDRLRFKPISSAEFDAL